jgi:hypothetical protein
MTLMTLMTRVAFALALVSAVALAPRPAHANGRFPMAQVVLAPTGGDVGLVVVRTTFGVLISRDGGATFDWVCEENLGFTGTWDPPLALLPGGALVVAPPRGLRSTKDFCSFEAEDALRDETVVDLTTVKEKLFAATSTEGAPSFVWRRTRRGWERLGKGVPGLQIDTIEVAPTRTERVYVTGYLAAGGRKAHFLRSDDGGKTLVETNPKLERDGRLFVSAVDPRDPNRVYVRQLHGAGSELYRSDDGGKTLIHVLHMNGGMTGFALRDDGSTVFAGSGDPSEGLLRSRDRGKTWEVASKLAVLCLKSAGKRLFVCSNHFLPGGFPVGVSEDDGTTVRPLFRLADIRGPLGCDAGASEACERVWPATRALLTPSPVDADAAAPDERTDDDAAAPTTPAASVGSEADARGGGPGAHDGRSRACDCATAIGAPRSTADVNARGAFATLAIAAFGVVLRRARRRRSPFTRPRGSDPAHREACSPQ